MLPIKKILKDPAGIEKSLKTKDPSVSLKELIESYQTYTENLSKLEKLKENLNTLSKQIAIKKQKQEDATDILKEVSSIKIEIKDLMAASSEDKGLYEAKIAMLPNLPDEGIKVSLNPDDNVCIKTVGEKRKFDFPVKNHLELGEQNKLFDFVRGAKISGSGFPVYTGTGAEIEWALINLMLDIHKKNGFEMTLVPHLVAPEVMYGCGQLPKFATQAYRLHDKDYDHYLLPTAEAALNGLYMNEILEVDQPKKLVSYSPCFRREAGAHGKNERGLIRVHQFNKVELFAFAKPEDSDTVFEQIMASAEEVLQTLGLHYRNMLLVTGDMSFGASKTVDIEVFLPGQDRYYEVSSVSNCRDFQARRSKIRYKDKETGKNTFVHTLNGSGLATARLMVAILENFQNANGTINIPEALKKYM
ncbi:MAG: Serine--tRNA ligase [Chlamydiia bacterium]|nr:Serine--tRNA ligase [Chlamydiia bacterium]MCH9618817.1 Serine--tRNA ligase [Chlamydiia bacterium]MCH9624664.1 Serine--tRNA ligase [Chlamydiia bacterium]